MRTEDLGKVARIGEVMSSRRPPILKELSFKFRRSNTVTEARCFNYASN